VKNGGNYEFKDGGVIATRWGKTPRESVEDECRRVGTKLLVSRCVDILRDGDVDEDTLRALAGPGAEQILQGREGGTSGYWPRVWAMRGFLYAWDESAVDVVIAGAEDESWRVREMSAKVIARHQLVEAFETMESLKDDEIARVRAAAERALMRLAEFGA
jgi:hypothetical protein